MNSQLMQQLLQSLLSQRGGAGRSPSPPVSAATGQLGPPPDQGMLGGSQNFADIEQRLREMDAQNPDRQNRADRQTIVPLGSFRDAPQAYTQHKMDTRPAAREFQQWAGANAPGMSDSIASGEMSGRDKDKFLELATAYGGAQLNNTGEAEKSDALLRGYNDPSMIRTRRSIDRHIQPVQSLVDQIGPEIYARKGQGKDGPSRSDTRREEGLDQRGDYNADIHRKYGGESAPIDPAKLDSVFENQRENEDPQARSQRERENEMRLETVRKGSHDREFDLELEARQAEREAMEEAERTVREIEEFGRPLTERERRGRLGSRLSGGML